MKITFLNDGVVHEFTPPDYATSVVIKTRANGVSIDYESSTVDAVMNFFDRKENRLPPDLPVNVPATATASLRGRKGVGLKLSEAHRQKMVKEWVNEKPQVSYDTLAARYGVHRTTVSDIIHKALKKPLVSRSVKKGGYKQKTWDRRPLDEDKVQRVKDLWATGECKTIAAIAKLSGVSKNSVQRILKDTHHPGRKVKLSPFQEDEIVRMIDDGAIARQAIAEKFKVHITTVNRVMAKRRKEKEKNFTNSLDEQTAEV